MAHHLSRRLDLKQWQLSLVDGSKQHYYQPGFLFVPFGIYDPKDIQRPLADLLPKQVRHYNVGASQIDANQNCVHLEDGSRLNYDLLIIATGSQIDPSETEGLEGPAWRKTAFDFYSYEGAVALREALNLFSGGELVVHITEMPIKCPVAPLEFCFLLDHHLQRHGLRSRTNITYVTPLSGAFTKPTASATLGHFLSEKKINVITDFNVERVDGSRRQLIGYDGQEIPFDLLVTVPTNKGDALLERSGLGDELNFVPVDKGTLMAKGSSNIFVLGDATDAPTSKAGSVAHFQAELLIDNIVRFTRGQPPESTFDGHANCFIETGFGRGLLIDFNYDQEPVSGKFPLPVIGPLSLLKENRANHYGKLAFRWIYWNLLLKARKIPFVKPQMQTAGKNIA